MNIIYSQSEGNGNTLIVLHTGPCTFKPVLSGQLHYMNQALLNSHYLLTAEAAREEQERTLILETIREFFPEAWIWDIVPIKWVLLLSYLCLALGVTKYVLWCPAIPCQLFFLFGPEDLFFQSSAAHLPFSFPWSNSKDVLKDTCCHNVCTMSHIPFLRRRTHLFKIQICRTRTLSCLSKLKDMMGRGTFKWLKFSQILVINSRDCMWDFCRQKRGSSGSQNLLHTLRSKLSEIYPF